MQKVIPVMETIVAGGSQVFPNMKSISVAPLSGGVATLTVLNDEGTPAPLAAPFSVPAGIAPSWTADGDTVFYRIQVTATGASVLVIGTRTNQS